MSAIAEPTIGRKTEYLPKIMSDFFFFEIECAKPFDTWCVNNGSVGGFRKEIISCIENNRNYVATELNESYKKV